MGTVQDGHILVPWAPLGTTGVCFLSSELEAGRYEPAKHLHVESKPMEKEAEGKEGVREMNPGDLVEQLYPPCLISYKLLFFLYIWWFQLDPCHLQPVTARHEHDYTHVGLGQSG